MFLDQATPDTSAYMVAGYVIFAVVTLIYLTSLAIRTRNLHRDMQALNSLEAEQEPVVAPPSRPAASAPRQPARKPRPASAKQARKKSAKKR